jgi:Zn-finger nucleic acid-binding protein
MIALKGAGDVEYDWCDGCERLFFDRGELTAIDAFVDT